MNNYTVCPIGKAEKKERQNVRKKERKIGKKKERKKGRKKDKYLIVLCQIMSSIFVNNEECDLEIFWMKVSLYLLMQSSIYLCGENIIW